MWYFVYEYTHIMWLHKGPHLDIRKHMFLFLKHSSLVILGALEPLCATGICRGAAKLYFPILLNGNLACKGASGLVFICFRVS